MKGYLASLFAGAAMLVAPFAASAQDESRAYDNGPVWEVSYVQTKPGHFDDYMHFLATVWRAEQEAAKAKGLVLDYKVLNVQDSRDNEPDLLLLVEYKNMAAFDVPLDEMDAMAAKTFGSLKAAAKADVDRETIRTLRGEELTRELILK